MQPTRGSLWLRTPGNKMGIVKRGVKQRAYHVKEFSLMKLKDATATIKVNIGTILNPGTRGVRIRTTTLLAWLFWIVVLVCATASFALKFNSLLLGHENIASGGYLQENIGGIEYLQQVLYF